MFKKYLFFISCLIFVFTFTKTVMADEPEYYKTIARVNFRTGPSTEHDIIETLDFGTDILVTLYNDSEDGWSIVTYADTEGYIKTEFIGTEDEYLIIEEKREQEKARSVELLEWSEVKKIFKTGVAVEIYDIYTGTTYYVKSFSNGQHADIEPVTKDDTAIMKKTFNNKWSWDVRPVWVTINGQTIAASINGMPHGGGVNNSNGMDGQVCLHFLGSTTHNGNTSYTKLHQDYVKEAYNLSK